MGKQLSIPPPCDKPASFLPNQSILVECLVLMLQPEQQDHWGQGKYPVALDRALFHLRLQQTVQFYRHHKVIRPDSGYGRHSFLNTGSVHQLRSVDNRTYIFLLCLRSSCNRFSYRGSLKHTCANPDICLGQSVQFHLLHAYRWNQMDKRQYRQD